MNGLWTWFTDSFNTRELAGAIWLAAALFILAIKKDIRHALANVVRAALHHKLLILFLGFAINVAILSWLGTFPKIWDLDLLIPTIVWYFLGGLPLLTRAFDAKEGTQHFRGYAKDALSGTALLEFIFVAKTFSFLVELILTPVITIIAVIAVVSERDPKHATINKILTWLLAIITLVVLWNSFSQIWAAPEKFFITATFKNFLLPIYMTVGSIPLFYAMHCYSRIESARIQIDLKTFQSNALKKYAKKRFIMTFMARPWLLRRATRQFHIMPAKEVQDVDKIIRDILDYEREAENPLDVDEGEGWSPYLAREILADEGMRTGDYNAGHDNEEWWSGVASKELDQGVFPSHANYSFSGVKGLAKRLKLKGHFVDEFTTDSALTEFSRLAVKLFRAVVPSGADETLDKLMSRQVFAVSLGRTSVQLKHERFSNDRGFELILKIER